jgi:hypothetical protein
MHDRVVVELGETLEKIFGDEDGAIVFVDLFVVLLSVKFIGGFFCFCF